MFSPNLPDQIVLYANKFASGTVFPKLKTVGVLGKHPYRRTFPMNYTLSKSSN